MKRVGYSLLFSLSLLLMQPAQAMQDQGLNSIMSIIDKAVTEFNTTLEKLKTEKSTEEETTKATSGSTGTIVNLAQTLGKLSYSRLQCGQADVLAEFTQRVQQVPESMRDAMRDAFQKGFDKSKEETPLLSADECERLTQSRNLGEKKLEANVKEDPADKKKDEVVKKPEPEVDPKLKHLRLAELSGQLAFKRKFCGDKQVVNRDFNEIIKAMPEEFQEEAKTSYWKGYKHGKRLNSNLTQDKCYRS